MRAGSKGKHARRLCFYSPYPDLKPLKMKLAKRCTSGGFFPSFYLYLPHSFFTLFVFCNCKYCLCNFSFHSLLILVFLSNVPSCAALDDFTEMNNDNKSTAKKFISVINACFQDQKITVLNVDQTTLKMGTRVSGIRSLLSIERKGLTIGCQIWKCRSYWLRMSLVSV